MRKLPLIIGMFTMLLVAIATGCRYTPRYDGRLAAADSLMRDDADSALAMLEALPLSELHTAGDSAYRDLLLTQARYRAYVTATSDSDINRALAYYRARPAEREKLTRAYIYKGAVMEELGHPDSAMLYYKHAENTAAPDDYFNLGYAKLRMGTLYNDNYSMGGQETVKYEEALDCFRKAKDSVYLLLCLNNLGCLYRDSYPGRAESLLSEATMLAKQLQDSTRIVYNGMSLVVLYYYQGRFEEARKHIWEVCGYGIERLDYQMCFRVAGVYARLGILDTADIYLDLALKNRCGDKALYEMHHLECLSELALAKGDTLTSFRLRHESDRLEDSLTANEKKLEILHTELSHDKETIKQSQRAHHDTVSSYRWLVVLLVFALASILFWFYHRAHRYDAIISDLKEEITSQSVDMRTLQSNINRLKIGDEGLKNSLNSHMTLMRTMIEECYHAPNSALSKNIKDIVHYQDKNKDLWEHLYVYIDMEYNHIMSDTKQNYPMLNDRDMLLLALSCLGYSCAQIAMIMGYANATSIGGNKQRLARKMGLNYTLKEYIEEYKIKD